MIAVADYRRQPTSEHRLQVLVMQHLEQRAKDVYWFAIPNAGRRSLRVGAAMKAEGLKAGVADLCIMLPNGKTCWLELKTAKSYQSDSQHGFEAICQKLGHPYAVARSLDDAIRILRTWGALK